MSENKASVEVGSKVQIVKDWNNNLPEGLQEGDIGHVLNITCPDNVEQKYKVQLVGGRIVDVDERNLRKSYEEG